MKKIGYWLFGILFHMFRLFPVKKKKVLLFMVHDCKFQGNIRYIYEEMKKRELGYRFIKVSKKELFAAEGNRYRKLLKIISGSLYFFLVLNYHLATAEYILLNDNFLPLAYMHPSKKTKIIQLWHGAGAFKRFGLSTEKDAVVRNCVEKGNQNITHLFVSSDNVIPYYKEALAIEEENIYATGVPMTDFYFDEQKKKQALDEFYRKYPQLKEKKILLYTPTFRKTPEENMQILKKFDAQKIIEALGEEWAILIRLHPQIHSIMPKLPKNCYDVTEYPDIKGLFLASDVLVNDYSSTVVEYVLLEKPIILFAYDLEQYDRGFYGSYKEEAPGVIVDTPEKLIEAVHMLPQQACVYEKFIRQQYGKMPDGKAAKRAVDLMLR